MPRLALCIPTYRRAALMRRLLEDVATQTLQPDVVIVVDGDPASGDVRRVLEAPGLPGAWRMVYIPSNHANLAYQRYLGWRAAAGSDWLLYLDDDLRLLRPSALEKVLAPLGWPDADIVAVTAEVAVPRRGGADGRLSALMRWLAARLGSGARTPPGGLSPSGHRRAPVRDGHDYAAVQWLCGGVMGFRMSALGRECFAENLFALYETGGKAEDTFLGRRLAARGRILLAFDAGIEHPDADSPKAYPSDPYGFARALAYSRRFLNDHYHGFRPPGMKERAGLAVSYAGNLVFAIVRALAGFRKQDWRYAAGYAAGVWLAITKAPTARSLTPHIDWWADAEQAVAGAAILAGGGGCS